MAYVHPRETQRDLVAAAFRNGTRLVAFAAYTTAVVVAFMLLAPVLFKGGTGAGEAARIPAGPKEVVYSAQAGDTPMSVAAAHGLSAAELYALNPGLTPFSHVRRRQVVVGLR